MEILTLTIACHDGHPPPMTSSPVPAAAAITCSISWPRFRTPGKKRGRPHPLEGLLAVGIAAVIAGSNSFAAIAQWTADAGPEALAVLGAAEESTFRRAFALCRLQSFRADQLVPG